MAEQAKVLVAEAWCFEISPGTKVKVEREKQPRGSSDFQTCSVGYMLPPAYCTYAYNNIFLKSVITVARNNSAAKISSCSSR